MIDTPGGSERTNIKSYTVFTMGDGDLKQLTLRDRALNL
jgi:hypothetical protein